MDDHTFYLLRLLDEKIRRTPTRRNPLSHEKLAAELRAKYQALRTELLRAQNIGREATRTAAEVRAWLWRLPPTPILINPTNHEI